ncbi:MAG: ATP-dependent helicase HrpB [Nitrospiraceae bacterium]|nr:ATP-dependent helicase HrpB [Nitrospiraceae bacterium]
MKHYPIDEILPELKKAIAGSPSAVLQAPPGAGKTTRVPLALLDIVPGRILLLEPRRIAAVSAARWMAKTLGEQPGQTVGYTIRFDRKVSAATGIEVVTEGILTRRIQSDPGLEGVGIVIFDEFHERSIHADLALALCLDIQKNLREDLKILVMSATLDTGPAAALLGNAPVITSAGRSFPVEEIYMTEAGDVRLTRRVADAVNIALHNTKGDILVFLPGAGEISSCAATLRTMAGKKPDGVEVHPLFGDLPFEEQERAILPSKNRKIVLATNIAETSLTIEGVHVVIDSGLARRLQYDPSSGMNRLITVSISRASAEQRKGRAGRLGPGFCYRLYSQYGFESMIPFAPPEILVSDLSSVVLELAVWGVRSRTELSWLDAPPAAAWDSAKSLLTGLGAIDTAGAVTRTGKKMAALPLHPRLGRLLVKAEGLGCPQLGADLAALLSERDILRRGAQGRDDEPDISVRLDILRRWRRDGIVPEGADVWALRTVEKTARHLLRAAGGQDNLCKEAGEHELISRLLLVAFPDRIARHREDAEGRYLLSQGRGVRFGRTSSISRSPYIIALNVDAGAGAEGIVHLAADITEELIRDECPSLIEKSRRVEWDRRGGRIVAVVEENIGEVALSVKPFNPTNDEKAPVLCEAIRSNPLLLNFSREDNEFLSRVALMRKTFPDGGWPELSPDGLAQNPELWLLPWLNRIRSAKDLAAMDLLPALKALLTWEQQRALESNAPTHIIVPSGSRISVDYSAGDTPVLAVKLQEMFGLADTPAVAGGRVKVLLHLLSPARRPLQVTQDLRGFWNSGYQEVKKEMKGRYPKHPWPDDPWNAAPTRRAKPKGT